MMAMLSVRILTPTGVLFEGEALSVTLPGVHGSFTVLDRHAPLISALDAGTVVCKTANGVEKYGTKGGFAKVEDNLISVCLEQ